MKAVVIVLIFVLIILSYVLYVTFSGSTSVIMKQTSLTGQPLTVPITNALSTRYSLGLWIYVNTWNTINEKVIFNLPNVMTLSIDQTLPKLKLTINSIVYIITSNFPIQKWSYVTINVDNSYLDLYLEGKLVKSLKFNGELINKNNSITIGSGTPCDITIANFNRSSTSLTPHDVMLTYMKGSGVKSSSSYGLNINVLKNNETTGTYTVW